MKTLAIIPARGGSKRIPQKNIVDFLGKPLLYYAIDAAREAGFFSEIMVSTDDEKIARLAAERGANVPFMRSAAASSDMATTAEVMLEVLAAYRERGEEFERFFCIYPACPLLAPERLREAMAMLDECDGVLPVVRFSYPPQRAVVLDGGIARRMYPEHESARSQDLEPIYHDAGQFYAVRTESFLERKSLLLPKQKAIILSEMEAQDIDTLEDLELAKLKFISYEAT